MRRLIRIAIYAILILGLYFWVMSMMKGYNVGLPELAKPVVADTISDDTLTEDFMMDSMDKDEIPISNEEIVNGKPTQPYSEVDKKLNEIEKEAIVPASKSSKVNTPKETAVKTVPMKPVTTIKSAPKVVNQAPQQTVVGNAGDGGSYLVMAGSYLLKDNANKMVSKLKKIGFSGAKVVTFNASQYHSVVAASYSSDGKAQAAALELKRKGIDSFVKAK